MKVHFAKRLFVLLAAISLSGTFATAQQRTISGVVTDANGPVPGAAVTVPGTTLGVVTDADGNYSISVPQDQNQLNFNFMGYTPALMSIDGRTKIDVTLTEDVLNMDEVIVVGYGSLPKRSVTTAIASINADNIKEMPVGTLGEALYGQLPGLYMVQNNGQPGEAPSMRIRGTGSLTASSDPLFVINGFPTNDATLFNNIAAEDIESIQILKDAASAAIYGSRAGNGVILITTKQGSSGAPTINFNATYGFQQPQRYIDVLNSAEFAEMINDARAFRKMPALEILQDPSQWAETNWQKVYFRTAPTQRYEVSARGSSDKVNYSLSLNYTDQQGIVLNSWFNRIGTRLSVDAALSKYVTVGMNVTPTWTKQRRQTTNGGNTGVADGTISEAVGFMPIYGPYMPNGDYFQLQQHTGKAVGEQATDFNSEITNPLSKLLERNDDYINFRTVTQGFINVTPLKGLTAKSEFNLSTNNQRRDFYRSPFSPGGNRSGNKSTPNLAAIDAFRRATFDYNWYWSNMLTYTHSWNDTHNLTALLAYDLSYDNGFWVQQDDRTDTSYPIAYGNYLIRNVNGAFLWNGSSNNTESVADAIVSRVNYDYKNKYVFSASVRQDRSSRFGPDNRAGVFWSVSGAWNITEEPWMKDLDWLSIAKVRASYGVTGNDRILINNALSDYAWSASMSAPGPTNTNTNYAFGSGSTVGSMTGYYAMGYSNRSLGWEKNTQFDFGIDLGLFNRVSLTIDYYNRVSDSVLSVSIPNLNGKASSVMMNAGQIRNRGVEIALNAPVINRAFRWNAGFNISFNRNKLLSLATGNDYYGSVTGMVRNYVGRPLGDMYLYKIVGTFNSDEEVRTLPKYNNTQGNIGDLRFEDVSGPNGVPDGRVDSNDMQYMGNNMPKFNAGFTSQMRYKNFDLSFVLDGQFGGLVYWGGASSGLNRHMENSYAIYGRNRWRGEFDADGKLVRVITTGDGKSQIAGSSNVQIYLANSDRYLFKSDYLKIRNVALGYNLPDALCERIGVKNLRVNVNAQNLWSFDEHPSYSVEGGGMGGATGGTDSHIYPTVRTVTVGLNVTF
jgi:TonB-linked SusC/RagA family outer membrane protein